MSYQIITINREFESLGNEIAQAVSTKLCIPYYDKFLITAAAEKSGKAALNKPVGKKGQIRSSGNRTGAFSSQARRATLIPFPENCWSRRWETNP